MSAPKINVDSFWLPKASSTLAAGVDDAMVIVYVISAAFFVLIVAAMLAFMVKYRRRSENDVTSTLDHSLKLELIWTIIPTLLLFYLFFVGLRDYLGAAVAPGNALEVQVTGKMYLWTFTYPDGTTTMNELGVPKGRPVKLIMSSEDTLHSFYIPEFRIKQDVIPGTYTTNWFEAPEKGETAILCTEYCGTGHSDMMATVKVMEEKDFSEWVENGGSAGGDKNASPAERGKSLYTQKSCVGCHSLDGTRVQGPSFKGLFGREEELEGGAKVKVDENYIRESILNPQAKVVKGYPPSMPTFQGLLKDKDIDAIVAFLKTVQ
jgi:cytochrome c oxidase subunit 2